MNNTFLNFAIYLAILAIPASVLAGDNNGQYGQYGQYGGGSPSNSVSVDKMVATTSQTKGGQENYVDNLSPSDPRFKPQDYVKFRIKVKNTSSQTLKNVKVTDILPSYSIPIEGEGALNSKSNTISWTYNELKPQEEKISYVVTKIKNQEELPSDKGLMCELNKVVAEVENARDEDASQYCIEKQVVSKEGIPPVKTPEAGAPLLAFVGASLTGIASGIYLKKKAS